MGIAVAAWASVALTAYSISEQLSASKKQLAAESRKQDLQREANQETKKQKDIENARQKAYAAAKNKRETATIKARLGAANVDTGGSAVGGIEALGSRTASEMGWFGQKVGFGNNIYNLQQEASVAAQDSIFAQADKSTAAAWGQVGGALSTMTGGYETIFKSFQPTPAPKIT